MSHTQRKLNRLKRWDKYNQTIKMFSKQPIIKKVDIEDLKKQFTASAPAETPKAPKVKAAPVEETETAAE